MLSNKNVVAEFKDRFGDKRVIHRNKNGLAVRRENGTVALRLNKVVAALIGAKIRSLREAQGYTLEQLCVKAGLATTTPKSRMWEIENGVREFGVRFGTLYAVAIALNVELHALMPTIAEVMEIAPVEMIDQQSLTASTIAI